jgi:hypothetical protein
MEKNVDPFLPDKEELNRPKNNLTLQSLSRLSVIDYFALFYAGFWKLLRGRGGGLSALPCLRSGLRLRGRELEFHTWCPQEEIIYRDLLVRIWIRIEPFLKLLIDLLIG